MCHFIPDPLNESDSGFLSLSPIFSLLSRPGWCKFDVREGGSGGTGRRVAHETDIFRTPLLSQAYEDSTHQFRNNNIDPFSENDEPVHQSLTGRSALNSK